MKYLLAAVVMALSSTTIFPGTAAAQAEDAFGKSRATPHLPAYDEAMRLMRTDAEQGDATAKYNLGFMYDYGQGVAENDAEAARWYRLAADQGSASAQYSLGLLYGIGAGVPENGAEAAKWFRLAAEQGHASAQANLGVMIANGERVSEDHAQAYKWLKLSAAQGQKDTIERKNRLQPWMTPAQIAEAQKLSAAWKPVGER